MSSLDKRLLPHLQDDPLSSYPDDHQVSSSPSPFIITAAPQHNTLFADAEANRLPLPGGSNPLHTYPTSLRSSNNTCYSKNAPPAPNAVFLMASSSLLPETDRLNGGVWRARTESLENVNWPAPWPNSDGHTNTTCHESDLHSLPPPDETVETNNKARARRQRGKEVAQAEQDGQDQECWKAKKQDHNAKERLRRMKLHASYLTLGTLLPDSPPSKKKWSTPAIIGRVLGYVPELQTEVEQLTLRKQQIMVAIANKQSGGADKSRELETQTLNPAVSVQEVGRGEAIIQICTRKDEEDGFSDLLHTVEAQGMSVMSASTVQVRRDEQIYCYHLHVQMDEESWGAHSITATRDLLISSLL